MVKGFLKANYSLTNFTTGSSDDVDFTLVRFRFISHFIFQNIFLFCVDAIYLAAKAFGAMIAAGVSDLADGAAFRDVASGFRFTGVSGPVILDREGERQPAFGLFTSTANGSMYMIVSVDGDLNADETFTAVIAQLCHPLQRCRK